jgi:ribosomal protein S21
VIEDERRKYPPIRKIRDLAEIIVRDNNIDYALMLLRKRTEQAGIFKVLNLRRRFPSTKDRSRAKRKRAAKKFIRNEKLRRMYGRRRHKSM